MGTISINWPYALPLALVVIFPRRSWMVVKLIWLIAWNTAGGILAVYIMVKIAAYFRGW